MTAPRVSCDAPGFRSAGATAFAVLALLLVSVAARAQRDGTTGADAPIGGARSAPSSHGDVRLRLELDSTRYLIGEWIEATLRIDAPAGTTLALPTTAGDFQPADIISSEEEEREETGGRLLLSKQYTLIVFDTGRVSLTARVTYRIPGDTTRYLAVSDPVLLDIRLVELDTTIAFKDITDVLDVPLTIWDYLLYAAIAAALALIIWYLWRRHTRRPVPEPEPEPELPRPPAYDIAVGRLREIERDAVWQRGEHKQYQTDLADTVRAYLEGGFGIPALEETTGELIGQLALRRFPEEIIVRLEELLRQADLTKFAKYIPAPDEHRASLSLAWDVVERAHLHESRRDGDGANSDEGGRHV